MGYVSINKHLKKCLQTPTVKELFCIIVCAWVSNACKIRRRRRSTKEHRAFACQSGFLLEI